MKAGIRALTVLSVLPIVTCAANEMMREIHDRMPVVLDEAEAEGWMNPLEKDPLSLKRLLVPATADLLTAEPALRLPKNEKNAGKCHCSRSDSFQRPDARSEIIFLRVHALHERRTTLYDPAFL